MRFSDESGWIIDVDEALPPSALRSAARYSAKINRDRWLSAPHGPMRERMGAAVRELEEFAAGVGGRVQQRIAKPRGDVNLFKSTHRERPERTILDMHGRETNG
jgi:hypothetical protein